MNLFRWQPSYKSVVSEPTNSAFKINLLNMFHAQADRGCFLSDICVVVLLYHSHQKHLLRSQPAQCETSWAKLRKLKFGKILVTEKRSLPISCRKEQIKVGYNLWITMLCFSQWPAPISSPLAKKGTLHRFICEASPFPKYQIAESVKLKFYSVISIFKKQK